MPFLSVLLLVGLVLLCRAETQEILASSNACGYSTTFTATIFSAPYRGQISGVRAVYNAGTSMPMDLGNSCGSERSKWGSTTCPSGRPFMVEIMKVTDASNHAGYTLYPTHNTTGYVSQSTISSCSRGCTQNTYFLTGQDINDDIITWDGPSYLVTTNDQFMLQVGEGCCSHTTADNVGHVCASMHFLYDYIYHHPSSPLLPRATRSMAIAYDTSNQIFWLIGGYSGSFNKGLYSLTNDRDVFLNNSLNISIYGEGQYYSMDDQYQFLYMIHAPYGSSLNRFNIETTAIQTNYATIPIAVTVYGCLAFIAMDDGYLVIIGGLGDGITDVQILNLASRVWMSGVPSMEYARSSASCAAVNGNIYAIGGYQARDVYLDSVEVLSIGDDMRDITDNEWSVMGHLSRGMCCSRAVVYGYAIYIVGGSYYDTNDEYMNQIHMIDALTNEIALFGYMDAAFDDTAAIMIDNVLYSFGGENGTMLDSWRYLSVPITDCDGKGRIAHINWNNISEQLPYYDYEININDYQQRAEIDINLEYLGYSYDHKTTGRYYLMDESLTWNEGQARCQQFGSNLATITSEVENSEAYNLCMSAVKYTYRRLFKYKRNARCLLNTDCICPA
eukprot:455307_1